MTEPLDGQECAHRCLLSAPYLVDALVAEHWPSCQAPPPHLLLLLLLSQTTTSQQKKVGRENLGFFSLLFLNLSKNAAEKNLLGCEVFLQGFAASSSVML